jgi:hypothetical protein
MALFRRIVEDYEARLSPVGPFAPGPRTGGKAEHERFEDGEIQFEVGVRNLQVVDGAELEVRLNGTVVGKTEVAHGRASLRLSNRKGHAIPNVRPGDRLEVVHRSAVLLEGTFEPD